jgi:xylan 1,4-beta-xylosidase
MGEEAAGPARKPVVTIWAPEIHYVKKNYFIVLSMAPGGISMLKSATGKPQGPYTHAFFPDAPDRQRHRPYAL